MASHSQLLYHVIWTTRDRKPVLYKSYRQKLLAFIVSQFSMHKCEVLAINGVDDHLHLLLYIHHSIPVGKIIEHVKKKSAEWIKTSSQLHGFEAWQAGHSVFTCHPENKEEMIRYIKKQEWHHKKEAFEDEYVRVLKENKVTYQRETPWA